MKSNFFMRRLMTMVIASIIISALLTLVFYSVTSNIVFRNMSTRDFRAKASYLSAQTARFSEQEISSLRYEDIINISAEMMDASCTVFFFRDPIVYMQSTGTKQNFDNAFMQSARNTMLTYQDALKEGNTVDFILRGGPNRDKILVVGFPVRVTDPYSGTNVIAGAVFVMKSMSEMSAGYTSMNFALIFTSCLAFLIMIIPVWVAANRLVKPINQTKDVAIAMSNGNFTLRADTKQKGELGELAQAINQLASDLDLTISALLVEKNRLQQILDGLAEGIMAVDQDLRITHINPALPRLMGLKLVDSDEDRDSDSSASDNDDEDGDGGLERDADSDAAARRDRLFADLPERIRSDFRTVLKDQRRRQRTIQVRGRILFIQIETLQNTNDQVVGAVGLFRDITESEKLEQTRRDYVANISHELRTPLTAMRALIEPLQDGMVKDEENRQRYYAIILNESVRLSRLIDDMLELSRIQAGQLPLEKMNFDLREVMASIQEKFTEVCRKGGIDLIMPSPDAPAPVLFSNPDRIEQVLVILIDNALKFTPYGGRIEVFAKVGDNAVDIGVRDTGEGIAPEDCEHIFERFYKADKARGKIGTGLGLSIASEIVRLLGGQITVQSQLGKGSTFSFTIPL